jgi:arylsulfatase
MTDEMTRRQFVTGSLIAAGALTAERTAVSAQQTQGKRPNVLFLMTDQQRADTICALGNPDIYTPNYDRLVQRGVAFTRAYSPCPVCVPARYTIRTGCLPPTTGIYNNGNPDLVVGQAAVMEERCGAYLARTMGRLGYRTFGIGKSHTAPRHEDIGFDVHLHSEELYGSPEGRAHDDFAAFIAREHPEYNWVETVMGERTEMYYMPQMNMFPANLTVAAWAADRAIEQMRAGDDRPWFGFVSFVGPHPPFAPPLPYNRIYDPDRMPNPVRGDIRIDHMDDTMRWSNHAMWADDITDSHARVLKARYYGEITHIDHCIGRILDAVEAAPDPDNTLICMFADHGDHLGDHSAWQKGSFFDASTRVPFLVSWPARLPKNTRREELVTLTDLFGIATGAAGKTELREGIDVLGILGNQASQREHAIGMFGIPGTPMFKVMIRERDWKYIFLANGAREQLFNVTEDPRELHQRLAGEREVAARLRGVAIASLQHPNVRRALDGAKLRGFGYQRMADMRVYQFDQSRGVRGFPAHPADVLKTWNGG